MKRKLTLSKTIEAIDHEATGAVMREKREAAGVTLRALGERLGVSAAYLSLLERGKSPWTEDRAQRYAKAIAAK